MDNKFLRDSFLVALCAVGVFWGAYLHLSRDIDIRMEKVAEEKVERLSTQLAVTRVEPVIIEKPIPKLTEGIQFPKSYYTKVRLVEKTNDGVKSIPLGTRVLLVSYNDGIMTVTDGKSVIATHEDNVRVSP